LWAGLPIVRSFVLRRLPVNADRFDALLSSLVQTPSRRAALRLLAGFALGGLLPLAPQHAEAKNKDKGKDKDKKGKKDKKKKKDKRKDGDTTICLNEICEREHSGWTCQSNGQCGPPGPCYTDHDCPANYYCPHEGSQVCFLKCGSDAQCASTSDCQDEGECYCRADGRCAECGDDSHCGDMFCGPSGCVECILDDDCEQKYGPQWACGMDFSCYNPDDV